MIIVSKNTVLNYKFEDIFFSIQCDRILLKMKFMFIYKETQLSSINSSAHFKAFSTTYYEIDKV